MSVEELKLINNIKQAYDVFQNNPSHTSKKGLKKGTHKNWLVVAQNPEKDSTFAKMHNSGKVSIAQIIDMSNSDYCGFIIKNHIYFNINFIKNYLDLYETFTYTIKDLKEEKGIKNMIIGGVKIQYIPDNEGKVKIIKFEGTRVHFGIRIDFIEKIVKSDIE